MYSLLLLTAACAAGAVQPPAGNYNYGNTAPQAGAVTYYEPGPAPVSLRARLRNFLGFGQQSHPYATVTVVQPATPTRDCANARGSPQAVAARSSAEHSATARRQSLAQRFSG